jgi:glutathione S-transferase
MLLFLQRIGSFRAYSTLKRPFATFTMANRPDITLYTTQTPNGIKISIALEELGYVFLSFLSDRFLFSVVGWLTVG